MKKLALVGVMALSCLSIASAKSYELTLSGPTKAGTVQLKPGLYRLKIDGSNAVFTQVENEQSFTVPVKVENTEKKFDQTRVDATKNNGTDVIQDIELGGSKTKLEFSY
jgi:maltose-binding protein MalE